MILEVGEEGYIFAVRALCTTLVAGAVYITFQTIRFMRDQYKTLCRSKEELLSELRSRKVSPNIHLTVNGEDVKPLFSSADSNEEKNDVEVPPQYEDCLGDVSDNNLSKDVTENANDASNKNGDEKKTPNFNIIYSIPARTINALYDYIPLSGGQKPSDRDNINTEHDL